MSERDERNLQEIFQHPMTSNTSAVTTSNMKAPGVVPVSCCPDGKMKFRSPGETRITAQVLDRMSAPPLPESPHPGERAQIRSSL